MTKDRARKKAELYVKWADNAEQKSKEILATFQRDYGQFDWTEPIKRGHHSQRRHEKVFEHRDSVMRKSIELDEKAKRFREKAENLLIFANTNKGDAEKKREEKRSLFDEKYKVGDKMFHWGHEIVITKINKKSASFIYKNGTKSSEEKSRLYRENN